MVNPADRTYPTTVTSFYTTTTTGATAITIDHVTVIDPWPTSPDPELVPFTIYESAITQRTVIPLPSPAASPLADPTNFTTTITSTTTWHVWVVYAFDMSPYTPPTCPGPEGCAYGSIKPSGRCEELGHQTRCARQCLMKDYLWWCTKRAEGDPEPILGRVCDDGRGTNATFEQLVEPCDHTDWRAGCLLCAEEGDVTEFPDFRA